MRLIATRSILCFEACEARGKRRGGKGDTDGITSDQVLGIRFVVGALPMYETRPLTSKAS